MLRTLRRRFFENPLIGRELAVGLTSPRLGVVFTLVGAVYLATDFFCYLFFWEYSRYNPLEFPAGAFLHCWHMVVGHGVLILLLPLRLSGHIEGARAGRAFDQVVVTGVSPVRMCLGNWALGLGYAAFLLFVTLPYEIMAYIFGGVTVGQILASYGILLLYSNVIIGVTLGLAVVTNEWVVVPLTVLLLAAAGIVSGVPVEVPPVIGEIGPLRFTWRQAISTEVIPAGGASFLDGLQETARFFFLEIPSGLYAPFLWACLLFPFVVLILLGPSHFFLPGFNVFGSVVLPGDSKRSRFRRLRQGLVRRIEMAFYYENRPAWCERWEFALRTLVGILIVVLLWGAIFGVAYDWAGLPQSLENDTRFHASFSLSSVVLFFWILAVGQTRLWVLFRERVGPMNLTRGTILNLGFIVLFASLFLLHYAVFERVVEGLRSFASGSPRRAQVFLAYREDWPAYTGVCMLLFLNVYLLSRVLAWIFQNPPTWRICVFLATNALLWGPIVIYELSSGRIEIFPRELEPVVFLSPYSILEEVREWSLDERFQSCMIAHACLSGFLVLLGAFLWRWRREEARWPLLPSRGPRPPRPGGRPGAAALLLVSPFLLWGQGALAQDVLEEEREDVGADPPVNVSAGASGWSAEGDLPLDVVDVIRGFDGSTFSGQVDFLTLVLHNRSADTLSGRVRVRTRFQRGAWEPVELPTRTNVVVRLDLTRKGHWSSQELSMDFEADGRRLEVEGIAPVISVGQTALPGRLEDGGKFLLVSETPRRPVDWQRAMTGGAVVHIVCRPLCLPEHPYGYAETSAVFLDSPEFSRWTSLQRRALYDYVRLGGSVILFGEVDVSRREGIGPWGRWFEGARVRRLEGPGGRYGLVEFAGGEALLYLESQATGEPLPLLGVRSVGPGRLGHLAFDPAAARLPAAVTSSSKFWAELTRRLPKSVYPVAFAPFDRRDSHLNDPTSLYLIFGYFALYTLLLGPVLFYSFRQKARRPWMWGYAAGVTVLFGTGVYALDWVVHTHPSRGEIREMVYFGPGSDEGLSYATVRLRSCGRQRHVLRVPGDRISTFDVDYDYRARTFVPYYWMRPPVSDGAYRELALDIAPWSARQFAVVGETKFSSGVTGRATYDPKTKRVTYTIESTVEPAGGWFVLVSYNLDGKGTLAARPLHGAGAAVYTGTVSEGGSRSFGGYTGRTGDVRSTTYVYEQSWRTALSLGGTTTPRFLVGWSPGELRPGVQVSSDDVEFRRTAPLDSVGRPRRDFREFRRIDGEKKTYLLHQQLILQEIPLEIE